MSQPDFAAELLRRCKELGIHTAVETCGFAPWSAVERVLPHCDLVLFDVKETDPVRHLEYTGVSPERIVENLLRMDERGVPTVLRVPVIPGYNDREEHLAAVGELAAKLHHSRGVQVMGYHRLGEYKYERLGRDYGCRNTPEPSSQQVTQWERTIRERAKA